MTAGRHLRRLLRGRWFRRLFAVRLSSQLADGVFQVALASYALFSQRQPSATALAAALAVVLLPFSVLGPFAGVLLDRWSRRQVLLWGNVLRAGIAAVVAGVLAADLPAPVFYVVVLACLSVNRFLLAGLSAALPHTVHRDDLVTANAVTPTGGTLAFLVGLAAGGGIRVAGRAASWDGEVTVVVAASLAYAAAGLLALRIPRALLGPEEDPDRPPARAAVWHVVPDLADGLRHLTGRQPQRRRAAAGLAVMGAHRFAFGTISVFLLLVVRNVLNGPEQVDAAFATLARVGAVGGAGFVAAAVLTPLLADRVGPRRWVVVLLGVGAAVHLVPVVSLSEASLMAVAFAWGLVSQGVKICVDTFVQAGVEDAYRGRVFAVYDVLFNALFVGGAAAAALMLPVDGFSLSVQIPLVTGYLVLAGAFSWATRATAPSASGLPTVRLTC